MADTPTPDWKKAEEKIEAVCKEALNNAGKNNHNPYLWIGEVIEPLRNRMADLTKRDPALYDSIMKLPEKPDTRIDKTIPDVERNIPAKFAAGQAKK